MPSRPAQFSQALCANAQGFSLHAAVRCGADQRKALEHLCRTITRPAIANKRLKRNRAGQVVLQLKSAYHDGTTHIVPVKGTMSCRRSRPLFGTCPLFGRNSCNASPQRFGVVNVCIVADRGMISNETIAALEEKQWCYILAARLRSTTEVRDEVLSRGGRYQVVHPKTGVAADPSPLKVKEIMIEERRYVVCLNDDQANKDAADRMAILDGLKEKLAQGAKALIGNKGYRKYLANQPGTFVIDEAKVKKEARYDGKWVLRTNTTLPADGVALTYKQLWAVEDIFRTMKAILDTRPIYHQRDETIRGHAFCSFLALMLRKAVNDRLAAKGYVLEWADIIRDLDGLEEIRVIQEDKAFLLRSQVGSIGSKLFQAVGFALPPTVRATTAAEVSTACLLITQGSPPGWSSA